MTDTLARALVLATLLSVVACEQNFNLASPSPPSISVTSSNTNTNQQSQTDKTGSDTTPTAPTAPTDPTLPGAVIPLPTYGETVVRQLAAANPSLLANSCQETFGEVAWRFLDLVIATLQLQDQRWGYLCKDDACSKIARDIVAYRASAGVTGIWIVDVIGNHCPAPGDIVTATWQVLPFETVRKWTGHR